MRSPQKSPKCLESVSSYDIPNLWKILPVIMRKKIEGKEAESSEGDKENLAIGTRIDSNLVTLHNYYMHDYYSNIIISEKKMV